MLFLCAVKLWTCLEFPQPTHVIAALETRRHHALVQTGLDAGQTRGTCSDHGDSVHHGDAACGREQPTLPQLDYQEPHLLTSRDKFVLSDSTFQFTCIELLLLFALEQFWTSTSRQILRDLLINYQRDRQTNTSLYAKLSSLLIQFMVVVSQSA